MEIAVRTWGFNPELLGRVVKLEGTYYADPDNSTIDGLYAVHKVRGDEIELVHVRTFKTLNLELHHFDVVGEYGLKMTILGQVEGAVMPSECSKELWGEEDDNA